MPLTTTVFLAHLAACTATFPVIREAPAERIMATGLHESAFQPLAIHDNTTRKTYLPATVPEAVSLVTSLQGHSLDAGVMQVNNLNWSAYGLTAETVFDPQANICAGARILAEAFRIERRASCRYNTGRPDCTNGYPEAVSKIPVQVAQIAPVTNCRSTWDGWAMAACLKQEKAK
jgi:type IV secretion system protein VirB1